MPRLALVDIHLAGRMDGWDLLVTLKSEPVLQSVPVLVISSSETINARGLALAGCDFLPKPFAPAGFLQAFRRHISDPTGKRILVVDDDPAFRRQIRECLIIEWDGLRVEEAANGK